MLAPLLTQGDNSILEENFGPKRYHLNSFVYIFWSLWQNRNKVTFEACYQTEDMIFNRAVQMAEKYGDLMRRDSTAAVDKASKLSSPPVGMFKLNVDAASGGVELVLSLEMTKGKQWRLWHFPLKPPPPPSMPRLWHFNSC